MNENEMKEKVMQANIALHTQLAAQYNEDEPHFRVENRQRVEARFLQALGGRKDCRMLDLGCGTGFMINIAKKHVALIHGVDITQAMLDRVDCGGPAKIELFCHDTGSFPVQAGSYDVVTAYTFLDHLYELDSTLRTAANALRPGGVFYADLHPNFYFWQGVGALDRAAEYDPIVKREIEMVTFRDENAEKQYGVAAETFRYAEFGKHLQGGFREEQLREALLAVGFSRVEFIYNWFVGQGVMINDSAAPRPEQMKKAEVVDALLQRALPLSRSLYKYVGFIAEK